MAKSFHRFTGRWGRVYIRALKIILPPLTIVKHCFSIIALWHLMAWRYTGSWG